jgi:cbb3-type cytochrome oxidase subunit 3
MMVTTIYSLFVLLIEKYLPKQNYALSLFAILLIVLSIGVIWMAYKKWRELKKSGKIAESAA